MNHKRRIGCLDNLKLEWSAVEQDCTSPVGLLTRAQEFFTAADVILNAAAGKVSFPAYFLLGHSVELSLKAFLLGRGMGLKELRKFGHDLTALLAGARQRNLSVEVKLTDIEIGVIELLSYDYMAKRFEYHITDTYYLPLIDVTWKTTRKLAYQLKPFCLQTSGRNN